MSEVKNNQAQVSDEKLDNRSVTFRDLGMIDYKEAWDYQENLFQEVIARKVANRTLAEEEKELPKHYLLFCEHPHVFTLGRSGDEGNLVISEKELQKVNESSNYLMLCFYVFKFTITNN